MGKINCIHDKTFKTTISDVRVAREFFSEHLPDTVLALIDLSTLLRRSKRGYRYQSGANL